MADSACLMQQPFSHPSDNHHETIQENPIQALGESISFGRFMTESLSWERWSSFNQNRYLEEVEKYSKPGSVAQKKAYFEAHYKRIAQQKAAALLEQANAADNEVCNSEINGVHNDCVLDSESNGLNHRLVVNESEDVKVLETEPIDANDSNPSCKNDSSEIAKVEEADFVIEEQILVENSSPVESNNQYADVENLSNVEESSFETAEVEEVDLVAEEQIVHEYSRHIESPNQHRNVEKQTEVTEMEIRTTKESPLKVSQEILPANQDPSTSKMEVKPAASSSKLPAPSSATKIVSPLARPRTPVYSRKENNATPNIKKLASDEVDRKRSTPKSLHMSINYAPLPRARETNKMSSPMLHKNGDSGVASGSNKISKNGTTPISTPSRTSTSTKLIPKATTVTPHSGSRRPKPPLGNKAPVSRKLDVKCQSLCIESPSSSSASRNKASSPIVSSSFSFRSDERAAKRKEYFQKLEEKLNATEAKEMQLKVKSKEKDETELKKMRQSLSFKAKPMPDFYREPEFAKSQIKKIPLTKPRSPKLGRKPSLNATESTSSLPPRKPSIKSDDSKPATRKSSRTSTSYVASQPKRAHENASPNIQS